jgi:predicted nucleotidyltransferase
MAGRLKSAKTLTAKEITRPAWGATMDARVATILAELRRQREACYGERLKRVVLFGSQARGDAEPDSDIDVLVVLAGPIDSATEDKRTRDMLYDLMCAHNLPSLERFA